MKEYNVEIKFRCRQPEVFNEQFTLTVYVLAENEDDAHFNAMKKFEELSSLFVYTPYDIETFIVD